MYCVYLPMDYTNIPSVLRYSYKMYVFLRCLLIPKCSAFNRKNVPALVDYSWSTICMFSLWLSLQFTQNSKSFFFPTCLRMKGFYSVLDWNTGHKNEPWWFPCFTWNEERHHSQRATLWRISETSLQVYDELDAFSDVVLSAQMTDVAFLYICCYCDFVFLCNFSSIYLEVQIKNHD